MYNDMSITENWIHNFTVTDTCRHPDGYTIYKITSVVFPISMPETLTHVAVWKRFHEVKQLYKYVKSRHSALKLRGSVPDIKNNSYFKRFHPDTISRRKLFILELLDFISQHPTLYKSHAFQLFFEHGHSLEAAEPTPVASKWTPDDALTKPINIDGNKTGVSNDIIDSSLSSDQSSSHSLNSNILTSDGDVDAVDGVDLDINNQTDYCNGRLKCEKSNHIERIDYSTRSVGRDRKILGCRRELKELAQIKVLQLIGNVMQVQDVSNNHIYIMKVVERDINEFDSYYYPKMIPYMVNLIAYYISDTSIFFLLEYASGKRLVDYIQSYRLKQVSEAAMKSNIDIPLCTCFQIYRKHVENVASLNAKRNRSADEAINQTSSENAGNDIQLKSSNLNECHLNPINSRYEFHEAYSKFNLQSFSMPDVTLQRWFSEIVEAIQNLHMENIYCFDLHPSNILLGPKGEILLSYFYKSIEPFRNVRIETNNLLSSVYIAPERPLNAKSDWWSAGIIFFELYTGHSFECCHPNGALWYYDIQYPEGMEVDANFDLLLHGMIQPDPDIRLSLSEIKNHPYFRGIKWKI